MPYRKFLEVCQCPPCTYVSISQSPGYTFSERVVNNGIMQVLVNMTHFLFYNILLEHI